MERRDQTNKDSSNSFLIAWSLDSTETQTAGLCQSPLSSSEPVRWQRSTI